MFKDLLYRRRRPSERAVSVPNAIAECAFIGTRHHNYHGNGKCTPKRFLPAMQDALARRSISSSLYRNFEDFCSRPSTERPVIGILIYSEELTSYAPGELADFCKTVEKRASRLGSNVHLMNSPQVGRIIGNKRQTNILLRQSGIRMPELVDERAPFAVFSNAISGSHENAYVVAPGNQLDDTRYNTRFIDTRQAFANRDYHTTVRTLAVGAQMIAAFVRARPSDESASVHSDGTPLDPDFLLTLQNRLVVPRLAEFRSVCEAIANCLGAGFYAHDFLVCRNTNDIYLAETGFKFHDMGHRRHIAPIADSLGELWEALTSRSPDASAKALLEEALRLRWLT